MENLGLRGRAKTTHSKKFFSSAKNRFRWGTPKTKRRRDRSIAEWNGIPRRVRNLRAELEESDATRPQFDALDFVTEILREHLPPSLNDIIADYVALDLVGHPPRMIALPREIARPCESMISARRFDSRRLLLVTRDEIQVWNLRTLMVSCWQRLPEFTALQDGAQIGETHWSLTDRDEWILCPTKTFVNPEQTRRLVLQAGELWVENTQSQARSASRSCAGCQWSWHGSELFVSAAAGCHLFGVDLRCEDIELARVGFRTGSLALFARDRQLVLVRPSQAGSVVWPGGPLARHVASHLCLSATRPVLQFRLDFAHAHSDYFGNSSRPHLGEHELDELQRNAARWCMGAFRSHTRSPIRAAALRCRGIMECANASVCHHDGFSGRRTAQIRVLKKDFRKFSTHEKGPVSLHVVSAIVGACV
jgi:hypothetical protein